MYFQKCVILLFFEVKIVSIIRAYLRITQVNGTADDLLCLMYCILAPKHSAKYKRMEEWSMFHFCDFDSFLTF